MKRHLMAFLFLFLLPVTLFGQTLNEEWSVTFKESNRICRPNSWTIDPEGNIYATGQCADINWVDNRDWKTVKYDARGHLLWAKSYEGPLYSGDVPDGSSNIIVINGTGVYVAGHVVTSASNDYVVCKLDSNGDQIWNHRYKGYFFALGIDSDSQIYLSGSSGFIKIDSNGNQVWAQPAQPDAATKISIDSNGNIYLSGGYHVTSGDLDFYTAKYGPDGAIIWQNTYGFPVSQGTEELITAMTIDADGNVYVTGHQGYDFNESYDHVGCRTIKYSSNGIVEWNVGFNGGNYRDWPKAIALDSAKNVIIAVMSGPGRILSDDYDYVTVKYDNNGNQLWTARYSGPGEAGNSFNDVPSAIAVDRFDSIYVTGSSIGSGTLSDFATIKYDSAGNEIWVARWNGLLNAEDQAIGLSLDDGGNVYVTGAGNGWSDSSFATIKYSPDQGGDTNESGGGGSDSSGSGGGGGCFLRSLW
jgi:hypothetical protein